MEFGVSPAELAAALVAELEELEAEEPGSAAARIEALDVLTLALHVMIAHGQPMLEGIHAATRKLRSRLDHIDAGGTWESAKTAAAEQERGADLTTDAPVD